MTRCHHSQAQSLLNMEFDCDTEHLSKLLLEGPPIPIIIHMVKKAFSKMRFDKGTGPSDKVVEMIRAAGDTGGTILHGLDTAINCDGKVPTNWEQSFIVCIYKTNAGALDRENLHGLKPTKQAMNILKRSMDGLIRQVLSIDDCK